MITIVSLVNVQSIHNYRFFFLVMRTFNIYSLRNFQVCNTCMPFYFVFYFMNLVLLLNSQTKCKILEVTDMALNRCAVAMMLDSAPTFSFLGLQLSGLVLVKCFLCFSFHHYFYHKWHRMEERIPCHSLECSFYSYRRLLSTLVYCSGCGK